MQLLRNFPEPLGPIPTSPKEDHISKSIWYNGFIDSKEPDQHLNRHPHKRIQPVEPIRQYGDQLFTEIDREIPLTREGIAKRIQLVNIYIYSHRERLALIEKRGLFYLLEDSIMAHCIRQIHHHQSQSSPYTAEFYAGATVKVIRAWIHNGFRESPQELAAIVCKPIKPEAATQ